MKSKTLKTVGILLAVLALLVILAWPAAPLWKKLGGKVYCLSGSWPNLSFAPCPEPTAAPAVVTPMPLPALDPQGPRPIIVDDDGSPDGTIALLFFLRNPQYDVRAVTVSQGEAHPDLFARQLQKLLAEMGRADIPVGAGRATPLEGENAFPETWRQVSDQFWGLQLTPVEGAVEPLPAARLMVDIVSSSEQPVTIFVSGSHTNLAEALRLDPGITAGIREVFIMGGSIYIPGNIESDWPDIHNQVAEWNIWVDPQAAREVFSSGLKLHLVPLDATRQVLWTKVDYPTWDLSGTPESRRAADLLKWMLDNWSPQGVFIWDLVAAVQATNPAVCPEVQLAVQIVTTPGEEQGRTLAVDGIPNVSVCLEPDAGQVKALVAFVLRQP